MTTKFTVWAPRAARVRLVLDGIEYPMVGSVDGWFAVAASGRDYGFLLDDAESPLPDPASRWQPFGVHGLSRVYDHAAFTWTDGDWTGRTLPGAIFYELHIGTFTPEGTFDAAIERLDHLVALGVTHVEVLPVNAVNGVWNWGYDGVDWYAVHEPLGGPDGFKRFVDAAHRRGLAVCLDVVYNHLGPSGNYLPNYGPYLKDGRNTWGDLINLDGVGSEPVRRFIIDNALMWLRDFHVDALRLDAVHALVDHSVPHLLEQLTIEVDALSAQVNRPLTLVAESDLNDPVTITPRAAGGYGLQAQWTDDVHHALHANLTGETQGYYSDFGQMAALATVFTQAFFHHGTYSSFRGRRHGKPVDTDRTPGYRFIVCLQDHDQVGNRAVGDRLPELTSPELVKVAAVLLLTSPFTPMLWMGEEWAASTRWPFFTSHPEPELAEVTGQGRIAEFAEHGWDVGQMIDPQDPAAFHGAKLRWDELSTPGHAEVLDLYRRLIGLRRTEPGLADPRLGEVTVAYDEPERWILIRRGDLSVAANLSQVPRLIPVAAREVVLATGSAQPHSEGLYIGPESAAIVRHGF